MTQSQSPIERWWDGLSAEARAETMRAYRSGQMTDDIAHSLSDKGVAVSEQERATHTFPRAVDAFLKTRHD